MIEYNGIGIAAPQIGILKQVCTVFIPEYSQRYGKINPFPYTVVINPKITVLSE
jgi:peptide deformylase